jgi:hypothetical protein
VPAPAPCPRAVARRQSLATAWRACGSLDAPWLATRSARPRPPLPPLPFALLHSRSRPPLARAQQPPLRRTPSSPTTWSSSPGQLRPFSSSPRPPKAPPRPSASRARAQSRSVSPARPGELTGVSRDSGDLSVPAVLPSTPPFLALFDALASSWPRAPIPAVSARSTAVWWPDRGEPCRRSAMAGGEPAPVHFRPRKRVR